MMSRSKLEPPCHQPPCIPKYASPDTSKRKAYSSSCSPKMEMDPDVVEILPPIHRTSRLVKQNQAIPQDVIEIDNDDDCEDLMIIGEKVGKSNKGKTIESIHNGYGNQESGFETSSGHSSVPHNLTSVDAHVADLSYDDDEDADDDYIDFISEEYAQVDEYALLQAHFDNVDIPPGIEAPFTWLPEYEQGLKQTGNSSLHPWYPTQSDAEIPQVIESAKSKIIGSSTGASNFQMNMGDVDHSSGINLASQSAPSKKKVANSQRRVRGSHTLSGPHSSKSQWFSGPFHVKKTPAIGFVGNSEAVKPPPAGAPPFWRKFKTAKKLGGSSSLYHPSFIGQNGSFHPPGMESKGPWSTNFQNFMPTFSDYNANSTSYGPLDFLHPPPGHMQFNTSVNNSAGEGNSGDSPVVAISDEDRDEIMMKFRSFKQFDTVEDPSDHRFVGYNSSLKQHPKNWAKKIQDEWKILEKDLPDTIFVRVYESRMDLLRAVIIGAVGTPYHDGLFFFDVFFPSGYPNVPPQVYYHSGGLRLNPNLYNCGKVCLSLLNTWSGNKNEKWLPGVSTILQVLVSIQGLILNTKPYFNEPGYAHMSGSANGETKSLQYNEDTFILSLRTMMYMMKRPPKHFENFVTGHFYSRAHDILVACKAYMEGAQVGCLVKGGVQDVDEGDKSCSKQFKESLTGYVNMIVKEFAKIGVKDCEKFLSTKKIVNKPLSLPAA
ncbi:probable ubiquitin-conjugating enzyme E2 25 isoform X2 [Arachis stenosperma]|uniref:probable ubiquitin-conjugating enzyme E2 25 isoform X2 n=1 Tax=Arachis stenosperma TaxID=217475 RepID=UPI0025ABFD0A|nr:probable ubiquitin-conjugating enzyme E2 25 isoform X2 [Arachis stenosperma]